VAVLALAAGLPEQDAVNRARTAAKTSTARLGRLDITREAFNSELDNR
jgi:hypothetical protein